MQYKEVVGNSALYILAVRRLAAAYSYANYYPQALETTEQAKYLLETTRNEPIPPMLQSYIYAGLATYRAMNGRKQDALASLQKAYDTFYSAHPTDEVPPIWVDHSVANLTLNDG